MTIPEPVISLLRGRPEVGTTDQAIPIITVAPDSLVPDVCFVSRAQFDVDGEEFRVVLAGRTASANLRRSNRATIVLVIDGEVHMVKVAVDREASAGRLTGFGLRLIEHTVDRFPIKVEPMRFPVMSDLPQMEAWDATEELLGLLRQRR